jgi:uncharacterized protein YdaU (DUF1376 family)
MAAINTTDVLAPNRSLIQVADDLLQIFELLDAADAAEKPAIEAEIERIISMEMATKVDGIAWFQKRCDAEVELLKDVRAEIEARMDSWDRRRARVREMAKRAMGMIGATLIKGKVHSVSLSKGRVSLAIENEADLPDDYKTTRTTVTVEVDRIAVARDLKAGKLIPGAKLVRGDEYVVIR